LSAANNVDDILDFNVADDTIFLDRDIFTGLAADGRLAAGAFRAGTARSMPGTASSTMPATGHLLYDADGIGGAAAILFATVTPGLALTHSDFTAF
jgi:Ca2+-binding RTX toxin-like protein